MILSGWGRFPAVECQTLRLREIGDVNGTLAKAHSLIPRGNGRAYGDAAINPEATLFMGACDRIISFDVKTGVVECEAGMLLSDLLDISVPRGWFPPVVPGTKFVTIGGLIAADVHGKNHHVDGSFGRHVESLQLVLADGRRLTCSPTEHGELFAATLGGMGLTGIILSARIRLRPIASPAIVETILRAPSWEALLNLIDEHQSATYSVAWLDCLAEGRDFGRGVLMLGEHAGVGDGPAPSGRTSSLSVPMPLPVSPLNRWSIKAFNELYYRLQKPGRRITHYDGFFFPLDRLHNWNYIYGRSGFVQYQCALGGADAAGGLRRLLDIVRAMGVGSFLAVLKKFGPGHRFLSFPMEGYTITLDFPVCAATLQGVGRLDEVVTSHGGRTYLAKDARTPREVFERGYPDVEEFRRLRRTIDPERRFRSVQSERLGL